GIEQAFLGGDQGALAVHMNRPALQYEAVGTITRAALQAENLVGHLIVPVPRPVQAAIEAAPGIEHPVDTAHPALAIGNEGRAGITHPGIIAADFHYPNGRVVQLQTGVGILRGRYADRDRLEAGNRARYLGKGGLGWFGSEP